MMLPYWDVPKEEQGWPARAAMLSELIARNARMVTDIIRLSAEEGPERFRTSAVAITAHATYTTMCDVVVEAGAGTHFTHQILGAALLPLVEPSLTYARMSVDTPRALGVVLDFFTHTFRTLPSILPAHTEQAVLATLLALFDPPALARAVQLAAEKVRTHVRR